jgi:hypothetical protein
MVEASSPQHIVYRGFLPGSNRAGTGVVDRAEAGLDGIQDGITGPAALLVVGEEISGHVGRDRRG